MTDTTTDDLPRFAATRELIRQYGDDWTTWAFLATAITLLATLSVAFTDAANAPFQTVYPAVLSFGACAFAAGVFAGVLWSGLRDGAKERARGDA